MNPISWIKSAFDSVAAVFNWATGRSQMKNSSEMQANAAAKTKQQIDDEAAAAAAQADKDLTDARKLGAE